MAGLGASSYPIGRPTPVCQSTGRELAIGEEAVALLLERVDSEELTRQDYSVEAWESGARPEAPWQIFGLWRFRVPDGEEKESIDHGSLADLFEQLAEQTDPKRVAFRYVIALMLIRKRLLVLEGSNDGVLLVRAKSDPPPPEGPALAEVVDPGLDDDSIDEVAEQLHAVLGGGSGADSEAG